MFSIKLLHVKMKYNELLFEVRKTYMSKITLLPSFLYVKMNRF